MQNRPSTLKLPFELRGGMLLAANTTLVLLLAFPVQVVISRYLGPEQLGIYTYVLSFANFARVFVGLSLPDVLTPQFQREQDPGIFSSALLIRQLAAVILTFSAAVWTLYQWQAGDADQTRLGLMICLAVGAYHFSDYEVYATWCKCQGRLGEFVVIDFGGTMVGLAARLAIVYSGGTIWWLLWSYALEQLAKWIIGLVCYLKAGRPFGRLTVVPSEMRRLLVSAWPIWMSALLSVGYARLDQLMLGTLLSDSSQLGQYSVAVRIVEALSAGSVALFVVYLPIISAASSEMFSKQLQRYHDLATISCLGIVAPLSFGLKPLVLWIYGSKYAAAADLSTVYLWTLPVIYLSLCRSAFLYSRGLQKIELVVKIVSLLISLGLNAYWIPRYGAAGSVKTTLFVQWLSLVVPYILLPDLRLPASCCLRSLLLPASIARLAGWLKSG